MPIQLNSPGWKVQGTSRGAGSAASSIALPGLRDDFLTTESTVAEEAVLEPAPTRGAPAGPPTLDFNYDVEPGHRAVLVIRHPSGALTFHAPIETATRGTRGGSQARFQVPIRQTGPATRGIVGKAIKAIVVKVKEVALDAAVSFVLPKLAEALERALWKKKGLREGWLKVTPETLATGKLAPGRPVSPERSLLFVHGTFSNTAAAYGELAKTTFFDKVRDLYDDRMFAFDHFSISRTPEENARMLLDGLSDRTTTFDVVTHSRGGLVLRNVVERATQFGGLSKRFKLGRAVLVAAPNDGTPLATPKRWDDTFGWMANLLELFPDNPFTTGPEFVANGLVWLANHAAGDLPGLRSMDSNGEMITTLQSTAGPSPEAYSALVSNYHPTDKVLLRLIDVGLDQFFGSANDLVVPSEGGWRISRSRKTFIPASRIGCFGPGGNLPGDSVTHVGFFSQPATVDFLVNALSGKRHSLPAVDPAKLLPDRRVLVRGATDAPAAPQPAAAVAAAAARPRAGAKAAPAKPVDERVFDITVTNGDLTFEDKPLMLGHYRSAKLTGTERVMDDAIGGAMKHALELNAYPDQAGTNQIFVNRRQNLERGGALPRPEAVIVVGLGDEGELQSAHLVQTVRQGAIAWSQRMAERNGTGSFELAATLIGSGGTRMSAGESARLIAQGLTEANELLHEANLELESAGDGGDPPSPWPLIRHLHLVELYLDRAAEAWRALRLQAEATPGNYRVEKPVQAGTGALTRPLVSGYRGVDYDFITVEMHEKKGGQRVLAFTLDTRRARSELHAQQAQSQLLLELVKTASNDRNRDAQIGRTLFNLLIPVELEAYLTASDEMQIQLDPDTAGVPWELLDTTSESDADKRPWAIKVRLLRKLRLGHFRQRPDDASTDESVLVVGEPKCNFARLFGARAEAMAVRSCLAQELGDDRLHALISEDESEQGADARTVINALFERPWRIVHIAGHGLEAQGDHPGGVVLSSDTFLGPAEISSMRVVPELVFVNCCHLASSDASQLLQPQPYDRAGFASGVAGELIKIGVRCVIAAGWAVDDDGAKIFAERFYGAILRGSRFIDAVGEARQAVYDNNPDSNTWAAYQCYGDPDWIFRHGVEADQWSGRSRSDDEYSHVASAWSLKLALDAIVVRTKYQGKDPLKQRELLERLEKDFAPIWGTEGRIAEAFALAFVEVGAIEKGLEWYERAVDAPDATASMKAAEQLANVRSRHAWEEVERANRRLETLDRAGAEADTDPRSARAADRARRQAERARGAATRKAGPLIRSSLALLDKLTAVEATKERKSLVGSAHKRQALVDHVAGNDQKVRQSLELMLEAYQEAVRVGRAAGETDLYYPLSNCFVAAVALNAGAPGSRKLDAKQLREIREYLTKKNAPGGDANFWSVVGAIEVKQYEALADGKLSVELQRQLEREYRILYKRVSSTRVWSSVYDTAFLVLGLYARAGDKAGKSKAKGARTTRIRRGGQAAKALLDLLRGFARPEPKN